MPSLQMRWPIFILLIILWLPLNACTSVPRTPGMITGARVPDMPESPSPAKHTQASTAYIETDTYTNTQNTPLSATATRPALVLPTPTSTSMPELIPSVTPLPPTPTTVPPTATPKVIDLQKIKPNELGWVPVIEYHLIETPEAQFSRPPEKFRHDLELLYQNNYYPITFRDLAGGTINVPAGKSPVVLTFDDSSDGQFRYLPDGRVDPSSAWGIMQDFHASHPDWPVVATFFPLIEVSEHSREIFGQPESAGRKLQAVVQAGGEIGSHTYTHIRLDLADDKQIQWQLAKSSNVLEKLIGNGYKITSLSLPGGMYPRNEDLIKHGQSEGLTYTITGAAEVAGGASRSPFARNFDPYHVHRIQAIDEHIDYWLKLFKDRPELKFISDGDPKTVTAPDESALPQELRGFIRSDLPKNLQVIRYKP